MGIDLVFVEPGKSGNQVEEERALAAREVRVQTLYSGNSAGTELTAYRGSNPYLHKQWDAERRLFINSDNPTLTYPLTGWDYEEIGAITEVGSEVTGVNVGARVYGVWGHRTHHVLDESYAEEALLALLQERVRQERRLLSEHRVA
jgi:threonine dehydrogenase-like Zn-dependent dehydrogenase